MPDGRRVQMAWGRIFHPGMPFTQMMLFPTEFGLKTTAEGVRLEARPIREIAQLHGVAHQWAGLSAAQANTELTAVKPGPLHVLLRFTLAAGNMLRLRYGGNALFELGPEGLHPGANQLELLIDNTVAEIFVNGGDRYILRQLEPAVNGKGLEFDGVEYGPAVDSLQVYEMKSVWKK
jgi:sucrose-6-phosphate hydrolase SacC (GH32 family)